MSGKYQQPTTVMSVVNYMQHNNWILPSIQRKFEWDKDRIINLFDSLLRGYPIGTLMLWKVNNEIIKKTGFFTFLQDYQEKFQETTSEFNPGITANDLFAVIDGQQRLNAILIGLVGSYAEKIPRKQWKKAYDESIQPREELYINLLSMAPEESNKEYQIQFFSDAKLKQESNHKCWFKIGNILTKFKKIDEADFDDQIDDEISAKCDFEELDS